MTWARTVGAAIHLWRGAIYYFSGPVSRQKELKRKIENKYLLYQKHPQPPPRFGEAIIIFQLGKKACKNLIFLLFIEVRYMKRINASFPFHPCWNAVLPCLPRSDNPVHLGVDDVRFFTGFLDCFTTFRIGAYSMFQFNRIHRSLSLDFVRLSSVRVTSVILLLTLSQFVTSLPIRIHFARRYLTFTVLGISL